MPVAQCVNKVNQASVTTMLGMVPSHVYPARPLLKRQAAAALGPNAAMLQLKPPAPEAHTKLTQACQGSQ